MINDKEFKVRHMKAYDTCRVHNAVTKHAVLSVECSSRINK